jgi:hypothetical protein
MNDTEKISLIEKTIKDFWTEAMNTTIVNTYKDLYELYKKFYDDVLVIVGPL